jgi:hypothetical protein
MAQSMEHGAWGTEHVARDMGHGVRIEVSRNRKNINVKGNK